MKLPMPCMQCALEKGESSSAEGIATVEIRDDGRYETTCPKGHTSVVILQEQKFELLFDIGAYAITDGYYREAVSSFTSSLERFYEFFIKVVLYEEAIDEKVIEESWKHVARQSERQLGAFIFLYTSEFGKAPTVLQEKEVQFRNDVVHRGKIPSQEEALEYGQNILNLIRPLLQELKKKYPKGVQKAIVEHLQQAGGNTKDKKGTMSIATIISLSREDEKWNSRPLEQAIKELRKWE